MKVNYQEKKRWHVIKHLSDLEALQGVVKYQSDKVRTLAWNTGPIHY